MRNNIPFLAFNRGLVSPKALGRVDIDRTRLSAETFNNLIADTQGSLSIRPGTKYIGQSFNDTGATWVEFVAATDDVAFCELANDTGGTGVMRIWLGSDAHNLALLERPAVDTIVALTDTGWDDNSTGGSIASGSSSDVIPTMTSASTAGVTITASSEDTVAHASYNFPAWHAADDDNETEWWDTGLDGSALPSWLNIDFDTGANGTDSKAITSYSIRASSGSGQLGNAPTAWRFLSSNYDTGTYAIDTGKWALEDERSSETGWAVSEKRTYTTPEGDTGTVDAQRHWRFFFTAVDGDTELVVAEVEMFTTVSVYQAEID